MLLQRALRYLRDFLVIIACLLAGKVLAALLPFAFPGSIIGMLLLFVFLLLRGEVGEPVTEAASGLLRYLPLLLVPPAVGVMVYAEQIAADFWALAGALGLSLLISLLFAGWLMQKLIDRQARREERP